MTSGKKKSPGANKRESATMAAAQRKSASRSMEMDSELCRILLRTAPIPLFFRNAYGDYIGCNPAFEKLIDKPCSEIIGKNNHDLLPKRWADKELEKDQEILISRTRQRYEWHLDQPMGGMQDIYIDKAPIIDASNNIIGITGAVSDITDVKALGKNLSDSTDRLESLLNSLPVAIVIIDYKTREIIDLNPQAILMLGYSNEQITGRNCRKILCDAKSNQCPINTSNGITEKTESTVIHASGRLLPVLKSIIITEIDNRKLILECFSDMSEQKILENRLREMAETDYLTGLFNRRHFIERAERELTRAERYNALVSMIMFDIDWFKRINDRFGHAAGDEVLKGVARICQKAVRDYDFVGRIGGEEFAMVLIECDSETTIKVADRIRQQVASHTTLFEGQTIQCTVSIGISTFNNKEDDLEKLMKRSDAALYRAKQSGRNQISHG